MFEDRVALGAALLDDERPGWADRVYLGRLHMDDCFSCVLGQLYGTYNKGFVDLFSFLAVDSYAFSIHHGFILRTHEARYYCNLADAWRGAIRARLCPPGV